MEVSYEEAVLHAYWSRKEAKALSPNLADPTLANLKAECRLVGNRRYDRRDEGALTAFFGEAGDQVTCLRAIHKFPTEKFKTLSNYLKGETVSTNIKNTELLAWLIDFEPRPYDYLGRYHIPDEQSADAAGIPPEVRVEEASKPMLGPIERKVPANSGRPPKTREKSIAAIVTLVVLVAVVLYWLIWRNPADKGACMYWAEDHYRPISCDSTVGSTFIIPLDSDKMTHFRKITRKDTITENALGSIWYANFNGTYECYTASGFHPIDTSLKLKLLTDFVLLKHIRPGMQPSGVLPSR
jgi:hypothetical protein